MSEDYMCESLYCNIYDRRPCVPKRLGVGISFHYGRVSFLLFFTGMIYFCSIILIFILWFI